MIVEYCEVCEIKVKAEWCYKQEDDVFNLTATGDGPYCNRCFYFIRHIEALRDRVTDIEKKLREET